MPLNLQQYGYLVVMLYVFFFQVDFWQPNSASLISHNATVDVHVKHTDAQWLHTQLKEEHIDYG